MYCRLLMKRKCCINTGPEVSKQERKTQQQCKTVVSCLCAFSLTLLGYPVDGLICALNYIVLTLIFK